MYQVYKTVNLITGQFYIGSHKERKIKKGKDLKYLGSGKSLKANILIYGKENFYREVLFRFDTSEEALEMENTLVKKLKNSELCLNLSNGGQNWDKANNLSTSREKRLRASKLGAKSLKEKYKDPDFRNSQSMAIKAGFTLEGRERTRVSNLNNTYFFFFFFSDLTKKALSDKAKLRVGDKNSMFGRFWITNGIDSKVWSIQQGEIPVGWKHGRVTLKARVQS